MDLSNNICLNCFQDKGDFNVCYHCGWVSGTAPEQAYHIHPGQSLRDRYIIGTVVGFGGFGITYKVWDSRLNTLVAVKEFFPSGLVSRIPGQKQIVIFSGEKQQQYRHQIERFIEEARNMAKFADNPNIVTVYDYFEENNTAYIVMEYLDGVTLKDFARDSENKPTALPEETVLDILKPLANALEDMHNKGIIHRDISPDNIFITKNNLVKLLDFGAARLSAEDREETMMAIIKPGYAPPEQYRAKSKQGVYTDIYALGATLYRAITGETPEESVDRQVEDTLKKPSEIGINIDIKLEKSVMKALALKPELRFQSIKALRETIFADRNVDYPEVELKKRRRMRMIAAVASLVLIVGMLTGFGVYSQNNVSELVIEPDTIEVWLPEGARTAYGLDAMNDILAKMQESYPAANAEFSYISLSQYDERLSAAKAGGSMPALFYTGALSGQDLTKLAAPLDGLLDIINTDEFMFLADYKKLYPQKREIPLSFEMPVVYLNVNAAEFFGVAENPTFTALADFPADKPWDIQTGCYDGFLALFGGMYPQSLRSQETSAAISTLVGHENMIGAEEADAPVIQRLRDEELAFIFGTSADILNVMDEMSGFYTLIPASNGQDYYGSFRDTWAVDININNNKKNIATMMLFYMMSEYGQEKLYLDSTSYCPLNSVAFDNFVFMYPDLEFIKEANASTAFWGSKENAMRNLGNSAESAVNVSRLLRKTQAYDASALQSALNEALTYTKYLR